MPNLIFHSQHIKFHLLYDSLTIYPKFKKEKYDTVIKTVMRECKEIEIPVIQGMLTTEYNNELTSLKEITKEQLGFQRFVRHNEDDHGLYHFDSLSMNDNHSHVKFSSRITHSQLEKILDIFIKHGLLTSQEKDEFLKATQMRTNEIILPLVNSLKKNKKDDTKIIIKFIEQCIDNDILEDLHTHLLSKEFEYLRSPGTFSSDHWRGTNNNKEIVKTNKSWAMIEKSLALKLAKNVKDKCTLFSPNLAAERAEQLAKSNSFFAIKRKDKPGKSNMYQHFHDASTDQFEKSYKKHFKKF